VRRQEEAAVTSVDETSVRHNKSTNGRPTFGKDSPNSIGKG